ncbi:hypothetical protein FACS189452_01020 [Bacteroidia bacterium]|nr:hypothetical protein FACS189452_01020 [Bacteroidia bacterium]
MNYLTTTVVFNLLAWVVLPTKVTIFFENAKKLTANSFLRRYLEKPHKKELINYFAISKTLFIFAAD